MTQADAAALSDDQLRQAFEAFRFRVKCPRCRDRLLREPIADDVRELACVRCGFRHRLQRRPDGCITATDCYRDAGEAAKRCKPYDALREFDRPRHKAPPPRRPATTTKRSPSMRFELTHKLVAQPAEATPDVAPATPNVAPSTQADEPQPPPRPHVQRPDRFDDLAAAFIVRLGVLLREHEQLQRRLDQIEQEIDAAGIDIDKFSSHHEAAEVAAWIEQHKE